MVLTFDSTTVALFPTDPLTRVIQRYMLMKVNGLFSDK
jgi:hypothetical protein